MSNVVEFNPKPALSPRECKLVEIENAVRPGLVALGLTTGAIAETFECFRESMARAWEKDDMAAADIIQGLQHELLLRCAAFAARGIGHDR